MTSINEKLGLRRAGKRRMMNLPTDRAAASALTAAQCPACGQRRARVSATRPGLLWCGWCAHHWRPPP
jgi:hypothetical protein